jgi:Fic-DOC domain mobile mystery protein B
MTGLFDEPEGATPLTEEDKEALVPSWVAYRADLNQVEAENILAATTWAQSRRWAVADITQQSLKELHRRMFDEVWTCAGRYRKTDTNLGVAWPHIQTEVQALVLNLYAQVDALDDLGWSIDELAVRFHHRLVSIHPFPNGNGRHARLAGDVICRALGETALSWGAGAQLSKAGASRDEYLAALRLADEAREYEDLVSFATR